MTPGWCNDSILLFDKPLRWTSFDVVNKVRRMIRSKTGHAGTLDPLATGLLILCTGTKTKEIEGIQLLEKEYEGTMQFGASTPSYDAETAPEEHFSYTHLNEAVLKEAIPGWLGEREQVTPKYSSLTVNGVRSYERVREGEQFEAKRRIVSLHQFEITRVEWPAVDFRIVCGKGYYVRSLVNDFARQLGSGAYLSGLRRTRIGSYQVKDAFTMDSFAAYVDELKGQVYEPTRESVIYKPKGFHEKD